VELGRVCGRTGRNIRYYSGALLVRAATSAGWCRSLIWGVYGCFAANFTVPRPQKGSDPFSLPE
jgi:hypothetical protein